jgi:hypothetical protein
VTGKTVIGLGNPPLDLQSFFDGLTAAASSTLELSAWNRVRARAAPDEWHAYLKQPPSKPKRASISFRM